MKIREEHRRRFEEAHATATVNQGRQLSKLAEALRDEGMAQVEVYCLFPHFFLRLPKKRTTLAQT